MTTTIFYISVKAVSATYILYKVWNMIFSQRMYDFWNMLHNWARIARIRLWKYRKKRMEEKARKDKRKARMQRPMLQKVQSEEQAFQPSSYSDLEAQAIVEELAKRFEDTSQDETLMSPVEEKPKLKPKIKPMVFDDPNEVMGKSNIAALVLRPDDRVRGHFVGIAQARSRVIVQAFAANIKNEVMLRIRFDAQLRR